MYQLPSPEQLKQGLDMNNFKPWASGKIDLKANEYAKLVIDKLTENSTYVVFAALHTTLNGTGIYSLKEETFQAVVKTLSSLYSLRQRRNQEILAHAAGRRHFSLSPLICFLIKGPPLIILCETCSSKTEGHRTTTQVIYPR